jgi:hypothetical protein
MTSNELNEMQLEQVVAGMDKQNGAQGKSGGKTATQKTSTTNSVTKTMTTS